MKNDANSNLLMQRKGPRELSRSELEQVNGAILINIGMGIAGAAAGMAVESVRGAASGNMSGRKFLAAAVGGFIFGVGGFTPQAGYIGAAAAGGIGGITSG